MTYTVTKYLHDFEFWGGAKETVSYLTMSEIDQIEDYLQCVGCELMTETEINDFFWFEEDAIAEMLGYGCFAEIMNREV